MEKVFFASSGLGDCIYSLPTIKLLGGGKVVLGKSIEEQRIIKPLLESQSFITECKHISEVESLPNDFINMELFRNSPLGNKVHLVNLFLDSFGFEHYDWNKGGWLEGFKKESDWSFGIINRTPRYNDKIFSWKKEVKYLKSLLGENHVYFMGLDSEYKAFIKECGYLHRLNIENYLEAAQLIARADLFSSNQSSLLAIRQGLGLPYRMEHSPNHIDCNQYSKNETIINSFTRRLHILYTQSKRLIQNK